MNIIDHLKFFERFAKVINVVGAAIGILWAIIIIACHKNKYSTSYICWFELGIIWFTIFFFYRDKISLYWYSQQKRLFYSLAKKLLSEKAEFLFLKEKLIKLFNILVIIFYFTASFFFIIVTLINC